jgi:hypothetical protein
VNTLDSKRATASHTVGDVAVVLASVFSSRYFIVSRLRHTSIWYQPSHAVHVHGIKTKSIVSIAYT